MGEIMKEDGVRESGEFYRCHPLLNFAYFAFVIGVTMFSMHPVFLAASFVMAWVYSIVLQGKSAVRFNLFTLVPLIVVMTLINTLNVHNGVTVLFYLNDNRITLEAILFGLASSVMLTSVIIWFRCFGIIVTADKLIYLFGRVAPVIALTLSMIMRYIPLLKSRFHEISMGQRCMGRVPKGRNLLKRIRLYGKELSILIAWSLEASIESADSMEARGYGLHGRTSFHLFRFSSGEKCLLALMLVLGGCTAAACTMGEFSIYYYPKIIIPRFTIVQGLCLAAYLGLMGIPVMMDIRGREKWNSLYASI